MYENHFNSVFFYFVNIYEKHYENMCSLSGKPMFSLIEPSFSRKPMFSQENICFLESICFLRENIGFRENIGYPENMGSLENIGFLESIGCPDFP